MNQELPFRQASPKEMKVRLNTVRYAIKSQNLVRSSPGGCIAVRDGRACNTINEAMLDLKSLLFNPIHKSYYNDFDTYNFAG